MQTEFISGWLNKHYFGIWTIHFVQIYKCLQPLMLCQSHKGTLNMIDDIVKDYDSLPRSWRSDLIKHVQPEQVCIYYHHYNICVLYYFYVQNSDDHNLFYPWFFLSHQIVRVTLLLFHHHIALSVWVAHLVWVWVKVRLICSLMMMKMNRLVISYLAQHQLPMDK